MSRKVALLLVLNAAALALTLVFLAGEQPTKGVAQTGATSTDYEYEVLPGIQPDFIVGPVSTYMPTDLELTCGWHGTCGGRVAAGKDQDGLDIDGAAGTVVYAGFRAVTHNRSLTAATSAVSSPNTTGCRFAEVIVRNSNGDAVGRIRYTHVIPSVQEDNKINLPEAASGIAALALSRVGVLAQASWTRENVTNALLQAAAGMGPLEIRETTIEDTLYNPGRKVRLLNLGDPKDPDILRQATLSPATDGENCRTSGPHLHQDSNQPAAGDTRNRDTTDTTKGFPDRPGSLAAFCSDTWVFKFREMGGTPAASTVAACPTVESPTELEATPGDGLLALTWTEAEPPSDAGYTITGYELRYKLTSASTFPATWIPIKGASYLLTGLVNGSSYDVELRTVSNRFLRSAVVAESDTPAPSLIPTTCAVSVTIQDADGNVLDVAGVGVTGGGAGACGSRQLEAALTNANYEFTSWTVAPATGLTSDCSDALAPCALTFGTEAGSADVADVTAVFTQKKCVVTANVTTLDSSGDPDPKLVGGSVSANGAASDNAEVPCGNDVTLTPTAFPGYSFVRWEGCTSLSANLQVCTVTTSGLSEEAYATAIFETGGRTVPQRTIQAELVTIPYGQTSERDCGVHECGSVTIKLHEDAADLVGTPIDATPAVYDANWVSFTAAMKPRWAFTGWSNTALSDSLNNPYFITVSGDFTLVANFKLKPGAPTGLTASRGDSSITLSWTDPSDPSITEYQYRLKEMPDTVGFEWGEWTDIPSGPAGRRTPAPRL